MTTTTKLISLDLTTNMFGSLRKDVKKRILNFLSNPTNKNWDDIYSIIIDGNGKMTTIWQAVLSIDSTFPRTKGYPTTKWSRIPTKELVIQAIQKTVFKINLN